MAPNMFKRTMARVEDGQGDVTYRCMACVRRELAAQEVERFQRCAGITVGNGMFRQSWCMRQVRQVCAGCEGR